MSVDYWKETISCVCDEEGIDITERQIDLIAEAIDVSHENYGLFTGSDVANANFNAARESELSALKNEIRELESKLGYSVSYDKHKEQMASLDRNWRNAYAKLEEKMLEQQK